MNGGCKFHKNVYIFIMNASGVDLFRWSLLEKRLIWAYSDLVGVDYRDREMNSFHVGLWHLRQGGVCIESGDSRLSARPGDWILLPPMHYHQKFTDDAQILSIRFVINTESNECLLDLNRPIPMGAVTQPFDRSCRRLVTTVKQDFGPTPQEMRRVERGFAQHIRLETAFLDFLKHFMVLAGQRNIPFRPLHRLDPRVQRCVWEVKNHALSQRFNEADLARIAGLSVGQLNRLFQRHFGQTSGAWLKHVRLARAKHLISTPLPIKEVAHDLGFSSPQHFSSWFRKETGLSPTGWRNGNRSMGPSTSSG